MYVSDESENRVYSCGDNSSVGSRATCGLTLIELVLVVCIAGTIAGIAVPAYTGHMEKVMKTKAVADITGIQLIIERFYTENGRYPDSLAEIGRGGMLDPWDRPYRYLSMANDPKHNNCRKLGPVHPLNSDYNLFSVGKDGRSNKPINAAPSWDDVVRAYDGTYIGAAKDLI